MYRGLIGFIGVFSLNLPYFDYQFGMTNHMRGQFRSPDSFEKFSVLFTCLSLLSSAMASISSITDITTQAASSKDSVIQGHALHISISPTMRYSGERGDLSRSFGTAFPLVVHWDLERRVLIVIEEPAFPIRLDHTLYYTLDEPDYWFNFDGRYGIGRDSILLYRADGWTVAVPDKWFGSISKVMALKRYFCHFCLVSFYDE